MLCNKNPSCPGRGSFDFICNELSFETIYSVKQKLVMIRIFVSLFCAFLVNGMSGLAQDIPAVYSSNFSYNGDTLLLTFQDDTAVDQPEITEFGLTRMIGQPSGTENGIAFNFGPGFKGLLYFGFIPYGDSKHPMPVYFRRSELIRDGIAEIEYWNICRAPTIWWVGRNMVRVPWVTGL